MEFSEPQIPISPDYNTDIVKSVASVLNNISKKLIPQLNFPDSITQKCTCAFSLPNRSVLRFVQFQIAKKFV